MTIYDLVGNIGVTGCIGLVAIILSIVQISPIKINPWSKIARIIGKALNAEVMDMISENDATNRRYRILRFDDEIRHHIKHTEEHFNQVLDDLDKYEKYCNSHPHYLNNKAELAIKNIKQTYEKCRLENSFLV
jgi:hypothetical protein